MGKYMYLGMAQDLKNLLSIESVMGQPEEGMPFGRETYRCLEYMLSLGNKFGFKTKDVDGFAGHIEWGEGKEIFGVLCHLDVVPAGAGWKYPPFSATEEGGRIYARGAQDDKSPAIAALYAVKRLKEEGFVPGKKFRLIMGLNEENGWKCIDHYMEKEQMPDAGFSPDSDFPVINCEKGVLFLKVRFPCKAPAIKALYGGTRVNMVPDSAGYELFDNTKNSFTGVSAHGSQPQKGISAVHKMFAEIKDKVNSPALKQVYEAFCKEGFLKGLGLGVSDSVSGSLTLNLGTVEYDGGFIICGIDIRYPISYEKQFVLNNIKRNLPENCEIEIINFHRTLYVPESDELVQKLLAAYEKVTGEKGKCLSIGGATYSRALDKCVAFGPVFPGEESRIHTANECIELDKLYKMTDIYYEALKSLL